MLKKYGTQFVKRIEDITDFVTEQRRILDAEGPDHIDVAEETVYPLKDHNIAARIELDFDEPAELVGFVS